jgi:sRNA-binding carbon storage regulator CsrA
VRIGVDAPANVPVHRDEVAERIYRKDLRHEFPK